LHGYQGIGVTVTIPVSKLLLGREIEDNDDPDSGIELHGEGVDRLIEHEERVLWLAGVRKKYRLLANDSDQRVDKVPGTFIESRDRFLPVSDAQPPCLVQNPGPGIDRGSIDIAPRMIKPGKQSKAK
jgi:hypothetical protein